MDQYILHLTIIGLAALGMAWMPDITKKIKISYSIIYVATGALLYLFLENLPLADPLRRNTYTLRISELAVIISLMGTGLKINTPFRLKTWKAPLRLVFLTMLLCIACVTIYSWNILGFSMASALLIGAVLAPTDPVLASDVQVAPPREKKDDNIRFALTAEAGMNDGMAFPFTWLAISVALIQPDFMQEELTTWFLKDFLYRIIVGGLSGYALGKIFSHLLFKVSNHRGFAVTRDGFVAISLTLFTYGLTELVSGYGFIAVFVCAVTIRNYEMNHEYHKKLHDFTDQIERILVSILLILFGGSIVGGLFDTLTWELVVFSLIFIFLIRPLTAIISLTGVDLKLKEKILISFFGIRGIGSFFYLAFALDHAEFKHEEEVWAITGFIVLISIIIHGLTAPRLIKEKD